MKTVVILQAGYLPWLGFFDQLHRADVFVVYDDVQFTRRDWRNRNRVLSARGPCWLTVPVYQKGKYLQLIQDTRINNEIHWSRKHLSTLRQSYSNAPYFECYFDLLAEVLSRKWEFLSDLNEQLINDLSDAFGIERVLVRSSSLAIQGSKNERAIAICKHFGAKRYLSGDMARRYLDPEIFVKAGIELKYQQYKHPVYRQGCDDFVPYLSAVDLLFNEGPLSLEILTGSADQTYVQPGSSMPKSHTQA